METKQRKKERLLILLLLFITLLCVCITLYFAFFRKQPADPQKLTPDYMPLEEDNAAVVIESEAPEDHEKAEAPEGGGSVTIVANSVFYADPENKVIDMYYKNPTRSTVAVVLQVYVQDYLIAQSGSILPGYALEKMTMEDNINMEPGSYDAILRVLFYDTTTYEKAAVDSEFKIVVTVNE